MNYAGLESHPQHQRARSLFAGFSGMLSFELQGGADAADRFIKQTTLPIIGPSLSNNGRRHEAIDSARTRLMDHPLVLSSPEGD